jgi:signal transduction histidine kinase
MEIAIIFRELTTNIIKHADATKATAIILQDPLGLRLTVTDNGKGATEQSTNGFGLKGIQERLVPWQGTLSVNSDNGCNVAIFIEHHQLDNSYD